MGLRDDHRTIYMHFVSLVTAQSTTASTNCPRTSPALLYTLPVETEPMTSAFRPLSTT